MNNTTGKRVQIYIPADLVDKWDRLPRYERSAEIAKALRKLWGMDEGLPTKLPTNDPAGQVSESNQRGINRTDEG